MIIPFPNTHYRKFKLLFLKCITQTKTCEFHYLHSLDWRLDDGRIGWSIVKEIGQLYIGRHVVCYVCTLKNV